MEIQKELNQIPALDLADYVLKNYGPMSHLKLQKLLFYCEAYHLAYFEAPLVHETFQAWVHGPVCREVYDALKGSSVLYSDVTFNETAAGYNPNEKIQASISSKQIEVISDVLETLSKWKDSELESSTHKEKPWLEARGGIPTGQKCENVISKVIMTEFYKSEIKQ